jgi:C1A family cysteine protease
MSTELTIIQDLRSSMPAVRDQGQRPLCLAFASSDLNSFHNKLTEALSVEYLAYFAYKREYHQNYNDGLTTISVIGALVDEGQIKEHAWPYISLAISPPVPPKVNKQKYYVQAQASPDIITSLNVQLDNGRACVVCISLPKAFHLITHPFQLDREDGQVGNHAVVVVGKALRSCGTVYFLIRNSWGGAWANDGHCWLSELFLKERTFALLEV